MAAFNPDSPRNQSPNLVGASRGIPTNRAGQTLFEGLGSILGGVVETIDQQNIQTIEQEAASAGNDAAGLFTGTPGSGTTSADPTVPNEIAQADDVFGRYQRALQQQAISSESAANLAAAKSKELRTRFPGYTKQIDAAMGRQGFPTANAAMKSRLTLLKEQQRLFEKAENKREKLEQEFVDHGGSADAATSMGTEKLRVEVLRKREVFGQKSLREAQLAAFEADQKLTEGLVEDHVQKTSNDMWFEMVQGVNADGESDPALKKLLTMIDEYAQPDAQGITQLDGEETAKLTLQLQQVRLNMAQAWEQMLSQKIGDSNKRLGDVLSPERKEALKKDFFGHIAPWENAITDGDVGLLALNKTVDAAQKHQMTQLIRRAAPQMTALGAIKDQIGESALKEVIFLNKNLRNSLTNPDGDLAKEVQGVLTQHSLAMLSDQKAYLGQSVTGAQLTGVPLDEQKLMIKSGALTAGMQTLNGPQTVSMIKNNFTVESLQAFAKYSEKDQVAIFEDYTSPAVLANLKRASKLDPTVVQDYRAWMEEGFKILHQSTVNALQSGITSPTGLDIQWNPSTLQFEVRQVQGDILESLPRFPLLNVAEQGRDIIARKSLTTLNKFIRSYTPVLELSGTKRDEVPEEILKVLQKASPGLDVNAPSGDTMLGGLVKGLVSFIAGDAEAATSSERGLGSTESALETPVEELRDAIAIGEGTSGDDGYQKLLGSYERTSGVDITSMTLGELKAFSQGGGAYAEFSKKAVPRLAARGTFATPMGKYQIVGRTLRSLQNKLGLSDDVEFTPEVQDQMFMQLLKDAGLEKYRSGRMSADAFVKKLGATWEGVKVNRRSREAVREVLSSLA